MHYGMGTFPTFLGFCCVTCLGIGFEVARPCPPPIVGLAFGLGNVG